MTKKRRIALMGASGHGKVCADIAEEVGNFAVDFYDDNYQALGDRIGNWPVIGNFDVLMNQADQYDAVFVAIGDNKIRLDFCKLILAAGLPLATLISPSAHISPYAQVEAGSVVMPRAVINADASVGLGSIINSGAIVEHECKLGQGVHISPNATLGGAVTVGRLSWIGIGACVKQVIDIGDEVVIGAGSVVLKNVADHHTLVGNPAKILER